MKTRTKTFLKTLLVIIAIIALAWLVIEIVFPFIIDILAKYIGIILIILAILALVAF